MKINRIILPAVLILFFFSCVKDNNDNEDCPRKIIIEFDWSYVGEPEDELVEVLITDLPEEDTTEIMIDSDGTEVDLLPDMYEFVGDESHTYVTLERCTVTVNKNPMGHYLEPLYFTGGSTEQRINETDLLQIVTIPMRQQTRPLIIRVILSGEGLSILSRAEGSFSGVTMSRAINDGFPPVYESSNHPAYITVPVTYNLVRETGSTYSDQKTLLGIDGETRQTLDFLATYTDGTQKRILVDVTEEMQGFHTIDVTEPWILELRLSLGVGELDITIEDWVGGTESGLIIRNRR